MTACARTGLLLLAVTAAGCAAAVPAGFWTTYERSFIVRQESDQGPWGGHRWIHWESPVPGTFTKAKVADFAKRKGWKVVEARDVSEQEIATWVTGNGVRVVPVDYPDEDRLCPRHINGPAMLLTCESGWVRESPGTGDTRDAYGYILVSRDGRKMAVYHLWGNA